MFFRYKSYPLSSELTAKSQRLYLLTSPIYGIMPGGLLCVIMALIFPNSIAIPLTFMWIGIIGGPIVLLRYRKKKIAQYDAEYEKILEQLKV